MRCPKCGYISFDYNIICPKCNKDIAAQQAIMNLPSFRPDPPSLLGVLTGDANESNIGFQPDSSGIMDASGDDMDVSVDDSVAIDTESTGLDEDQDLDISLEDSEEITMSEDMGEGDEETVSDFNLEDEGEGGEISFDLEEDTSLKTQEDAVSLELGDDFDESTISLDEISLDEEEPGEVAMEEAALSLDEVTDVTEDTGISLDEISLDEGEPGEPVMEEAALSLDEDTGLAEDAGINLDEISLDEGELGELDMGEEEISLDDDSGLKLEDFSLGEEEETKAEISEGDELDLGSLAMETAESPPEENAEIELNIDDLKINETGELEIGTIEPAHKPDDGSLDLGDLAIDSVETEEKGAAGDKALNESLEIDLEALVADDGDDKKKAGPEDGEESLDLENLDLDFDLDNSEEK